VALRHLFARALLVSTLAVTLVAPGCGGPPSGPTPDAPTLTCPSNITLTGVVGGAQTVPYTTPTPNGGAVPVATVCTPSSGSRFSTGATTVTCTATDALNRQAACTFSVTLDPLRLSVRRFVAFGDSLTAGEDGLRLQIRIAFVDPIRAYPAVLQGLFARDFPDDGVTVANAGRGGARIADDLRRLQDEVLRPPPPDVLLLLHGYNDLANGGLAAVDGVVIALREAIRIARMRGAQHVFLGTLTPSRPATGPFNRTIDPRAVQQTNARLPSMAAAEGARLVNLYDVFVGREAELVGDDGLHLTPAGYQMVAETFYAAIRGTGLTSSLSF
jgi:lysophospholipase L1-like esterase